MLFGSKDLGKHRFTRGVLTWCLRLTLLDDSWTGVLVSKNQQETRTSSSRPLAEELISCLDLI